jgi:hypothetical protein
MKPIPPLLCLALICSLLVGILPQHLANAQETPPEPQAPKVILLTPQNISHPLEPQTFRITMTNTKNASRGYPPSCSLILHEANLDRLRCTLRVVTTALFWQSKNVEAWLTVDDQAQTKLERSAFDQKTGVALVGAIYTSDYELSLTGLGEGSYILKFRVFSPPDYDLGNASDNTFDNFYFEGSVLYRIDLTYPTIGDLSIKDTLYFTNDLELSCTIDEPSSWVAYSLDDQANVTINTNYALNNTTNEPPQAKTNLTDLGEGSHRLTLYANDTAGNMATPQTITFTVNTALPTIIVIAIISTVVSAIVVFLLVRKRHHRITKPPV